MLAVNDKKFALIQDCADQSPSLLGRRHCYNTIAAEVHARGLRMLNGGKSAKFFQLDNRVSMMMNLQLASKMPLMRTSAPVLYQLLSEPEPDSQRR
jgi:hypothetical protein